ncbi:hypothetical protein N7492_008261 [Penicillium capsulatum]|uniref:Uncharacterized protein n=1 Tax=Penicillium capsulatum TaxID=69766 RepID=A0A9W9LGS0_9EURO|nr:hypothetical protein N7492_008261 [Penicillium capsulatum]KAJ6105670.1 hypothetical protein N7512_009187 [Penicillium capsulatum]
MRGPVDESCIAGTRQIPPLRHCTIIPACCFSLPLFDREFDLSYLGLTAPAFPFDLLNFWRFPEAP